MGQIGSGCLNCKQLRRLRLRHNFVCQASVLESNAQGYNSLYTRTYEMDERNFPLLGRHCNEATTD
jgi:hypothetical protein